MINFIGCNVGCNIVDPECDEGEHYTEQVYLKNIEVYRSYGITHIEFSHVTVINEEEAGRIREFCRKVGIVPWSIHSEHLNSPDQNAIDEYFRIQTHCSKIAKALDAKVVVCHIPNLEPRAGDMDRDLKILTQLADITREYELKLAIETPPYDYIIQLVDTINRDDVGMNLDTGHTFLEGRNPDEVAEKIGKRLFTTHLQDNFGTNDDHQPPGLGKINWRKLLTALKKIEYNGPLMLELTGAGVKARRSTLELRTLELDKELLFAKAYLEYLSKTI